MVSTKAACFVHCSIFVRLASFFTLSVSFLRRLGEVFLIGGKKEKMGLVKLDSALAMALEQKVDLVLINPDQKPPVARLIKWDRYKFELEKEKKEKKAGATV